MHVFVVQFRLAMTLGFWVLALYGFLRRVRHGYLDLDAVALAFVPFGLLALQSYGGEMLLRVYLFSLPFMAFLAAAAFIPSPSRPLSAWPTRALAVAALGLILALMGPDTETSERMRSRPRRRLRRHTSTRSRPMEPTSEP